jgi:hypothetical protein
MDSEARGAQLQLMGYDLPVTAVCLQQPVVF